MGIFFFKSKCLAAKDQGAFSWHCLALCWVSGLTQEAFAAPLGCRAAMGWWLPVALMKLAWPLFQGLIGGPQPILIPFIHSLEPSCLFYLTISQIGFLFLLTNKFPPIFLLSVWERGEEVLFCVGKGQVWQWLHCRDQRTVWMMLVSTFLLAWLHILGPWAFWGSSVSASGLTIEVRGFRHPLLQLTGFL